MDIPKPLRELMDKDPSVKLFVETIIGKIERLEKRFGDLEKERLPFYKPDANRRNRKYTVHRYWCRRCRKLVHRKVPDAVPNSRFGIRLMLWVDFQRHAINMPFSKIRHELEYHFGINSTEASLCNGVARLAGVFGNEYKSIMALMREANCNYFDDTGWRVNGRDSHPRG